MTRVRNTVKKAVGNFMVILYKRTVERADETGHGGLVGGGGWGERERER